MENLRTDLFINVLCANFDARTLAQLAAVCKRFHGLIWSNARLKHILDYHMVWLDHPREFLGVTHVLRKRLCCIGRNLNFEGGCAGFITFLGHIGEFNDFYAVGNQAEREIDRIVASGHIKKFLLIGYAPLANERYNLGTGLGTIHRGTSIVIYY